MTKADILTNIRKEYPDFTEEQVNKSLDDLVLAGLVELYPMGLPMSPAQEARIKAELAAEHPEFGEGQVQEMLEAMVASGVIVRQP